MTINLTSWRERKVILNNYKHFSILLSFTLLVFSILIFSKFYLRQLQYSQMYYNQKIYQQIKESKPATDLETAEKSLQSLKQQINIIELSDNKQLKFWHEYSLLRQNLPNSVQLTKIKWDQHMLELEGHSLHSEHVARIIKTLSQSRLFTLVQLKVFSQSEHDFQTHFIIQAQHSLETVE